MNSILSFIPTLTSSGFTSLSQVITGGPSLSFTMPMIYVPYFEKLSGGVVLTVNVASSPSPLSSIHSISSVRHFAQSTRGGKYVVPHFLHFVPRSLFSFNPSKNLPTFVING